MLSIQNIMVLGNSNGFPISKALCRHKILQKDKRSEMHGNKQNAREHILNLPAPHSYFPLCSLSCCFIRQPHVASFQEEGVNPFFSFLDENKYQNRVWFVDPLLRNHQEYLLIQDYHIIQPPKQDVLKSRTHLREKQKALTIMPGEQA